MKEKRFTEQEILSILKVDELGIPAKDLAREHEVGESTLYSWNSK